MSDTDSHVQTGLPTEELTHEDYQELSSYVEQLRLVDEGLEKKSNTDPLLRSSSRAMVARLVSEVRGTEGNKTAMQALTEAINDTLAALELEKKSVSARLQCLQRQPRQSLTTQECRAEIESEVGSLPAEGGGASRQSATGSTEKLATSQSTETKQKPGTRSIDRKRGAWVRQR